MVFKYTLCIIFSVKDVLCNVLLDALKIEFSTIQSFTHLDIHFLGSITSDESFRGVSHGVPVGNQILGIVSRQLLIGSLCTSQPCQCFYLSVCWCAAFHNGASFNCWGGNLVILVSIYRRVVGLIVNQLFKIDTSLTSGLQLVMSGLWGYSI